MLPRQMAQEGLHLSRPHLFGIPHVVEENGSACPVRIGLFGADAVAQRPDSGAHRIQEFGRRAGSGSAALNC